MIEATINNRVAKLHREAMDLATLGSIAEAYAKERQAAELLIDRIDLEPTRSVLLRSAASLALECGERTEALRLIERGLAGNAPAGIREELLGLMRRVQGDGGDKA